MSKSAYKHDRTYQLCTIVFISRFAHLYIMQVQTLSWKLYIADDNDVRPHTIQEHNESTSTEFSLVTA